MYTKSNAGYLLSVEAETVRAACLRKPRESKPGSIFAQLHVVSGYKGDLLV